MTPPVFKGIVMKEIFWFYFLPISLKFVHEVNEFPALSPVTWSLDVFFDLRMNKQLSKQ